MFGFEFQEVSIQTLAASQALNVLNSWVVNEEGCVEDTLVISTMSTKFTLIPPCIQAYHTTQFRLQASRHLKNQQLRS